MLTKQPLARTRIKICGITNLDDALHAVAAGADALGFVFYEKSPRYITPSKAAEIIRELPVFVHAVGLFVNHSVEEITATVALCRLDVVQLHGDESPALCSSLPHRVMKAIAVDSKEDVLKVKAYHCAVLLDTKAPDGVYGGTGHAFNWDLLTGLKHNYPLILAGGLNAQNIQEALTVQDWYAVDVSSGVEVSHGLKDHQKIKDFCGQVIQHSKGKS